MMVDESEQTRMTISMAGSIVTAYLRNHPTPVTEIGGLIRSVHDALTGTGTAVTAHENPPEPAVPIKKSVFKDAVVCLECGQKLKILRRHLHTNHQLSTDAYRRKWGLPDNYPLVAPNYAEERSKMAVALGLGHRRRRSV